VFAGSLSAVTGPGISARRTAALALLLLAVLGATPRASADATTDERTAEIKLLKIINRARDAKGLKLLKEHDVIRAEAEGQSQRMADQGGLNHNGLQQRENRIAKADSGIDPDQICENVASAKSSNVQKSMKKIFVAWRASQPHEDCMLDGLGYEERSAGVGVVFQDGVFWVTFIAASDTTPGSS